METHRIAVGLTEELAEPPSSPTERGDAPCRGALARARLADVIRALACDGNDSAVVVELFDPDRHAAAECTCAMNELNAYIEAIVLRDRQQRIPPSHTRTRPLRWRSGRAVA